jgi:hypothetical protein
MNALKEMLRTICDKARVRTDGSVNIVGGTTGSSTPAGCCCLQALVASENTWRVRGEVMNVDENGEPTNWPNTLESGTGGTLQPLPPGVLGPEAPGAGTGGTVTTPLPGGNADWGFFDPTGAPLNAPHWRILGHELCGHAFFLDSGTHWNTPPGHTGDRGDRPEHDQAIGAENDVAREHNAPTRGTWDDPGQGESFVRPN